MIVRVLREVGFVHLHVHSSYSLLEGALKVADLAKLAALDKQPALALTDTNNLFGALEFSEKLSGMGIQPIAGIQLSVLFEEPDPTARVTTPVVSNIVLLAQSEEGYRNLMRLGSRAYFDVPLGEPPRLAAHWLRAHCEGLIGLTGGPSGPLDSALHSGQREDLAQARLEILKNALGSQLYV
jgi:DNA polymerase III subunit alpha